MKVLHLEDEKDMQRATARLLRHTFNDLNLAIDVADTASGAIELLQQNNYDFVLSDYVLLRGNGGHVLEWIRTNQPAMVERFVFFSGSSSLHLLHHKVIAKGIDIAEFVEKLQRYLAPTVPA